MTVQKLIKNMPSKEELAASSPEDIFSLFEVDSHRGMSADSVEARFDLYGKNEVDSKPKLSWRDLLIRQFQSSVVILLLVAAGISFLTRDHLQAIGILVAVVINAVVGFATEMKSQISLESLEALSQPSSLVLRDGEQVLVKSTELVPGDIVYLQQGTRVPCDLRLVEASRLKIDESVLTGESVPQSKSTKLIKGEESSSTLALHGTHVIEGRGVGIVIRTGKETSLGQLKCALFEGHSEPTPLEVKLDVLGGQLTWLTVIICVLIAIVGLLYKHDIWTMLESSIALAVAAIPEGLPVVATLALAIGTQRMVKLGALVRQLSAVETLGCTTVICSDKTGTLTKNELTVTDLYVDSELINVSGSGYGLEGKLSISEADYELVEGSVTHRLLETAVLCNDANLTGSDHEEEILGDPTEAALLVVAEKAGVKTSELRESFERLHEIPFDLERKKMTTFNRMDGGIKLLSKGSAERIIEDCTFIMTAGGVIEFGDDMKTEYISKNEEFAEDGLRVLAFAMRSVDSNETEFEKIKDDEELIFLGLAAMRDLPREGVLEAIDECHQAGIRVMMLTGDHPTTAKRIAGDLKILEGKDETLSGSELVNLEPDELKEKLTNASVLARVTPSIKLNVVKALQSQGNIVAMTGDGVNDAPALQQANIGVAMGLSGTDLAREASNMVITDDNFSTIVKAIERGRVIYDNIKRSICYLLTAAVASVITIALVIVYDGTLAMSPLQLLWLNLIMHIFPGLGIVLQGAAAGVMKKPPRDPQEKFLGRFEIKYIVVQSFVVSFAVLGAIIYNKHMTGADTTTTTVAFTTISLALLYQAWSWLYTSRPEEATSDKAPVNKFMYLMMGISYVLIPAAIYIPDLQVVLKTTALDQNGILISFTAATLSLATCKAFELLDSLWYKINSVREE